MIEKELKNNLSNPLLLSTDILKLQHLSMKFSQVDKSEINLKKILLILKSCFSLIYSLYNTNLNFTVLFQKTTLLIFILIKILSKP